MNRPTLVSCFVFFAATIGGLTGLIAEETDSPNFVQYGKMHEVIGQQQHQGRVNFEELIKKPHFYGVGALESLAGEATIFDGRVTLTKVKPDSALSPEKLSSKTQAALLVGAYVKNWSEHPLTKTVPSDDLNSLIEQTANQAGLKTDQPFLFVIKGDFQSVQFHVINGACPLRARMRKEVLPKDKRPYEANLPKVSGKLVGVFAKDAVGNITHPGTSVHMHLLFKDSQSGNLRTGHVEKVTIQPGAKLLLPE
ncbi:acetolactate decarboxylase [Gimesia fumaroli]|uniref:Alpha-acetolactate decarboxylase n=1 Tax=Gimesia fumaroli TaxID=2527976 RepID=A0A518I6Z3_9PLAN|nr:acetolactate decarboxylase [Gimesia fumaroli]QDV48848.1 Alpha-acetolactate decarboxylase [Gimesia fumaroli]